jgi:hypothetical protein
MTPNRMEAVRPLLFSLPVLLVSGCYYAPPVRSEQGPDYARYVYSLYDSPRPGAPPQQVHLRFPLNAAVAEVGELSPPQALLETLRPQAQLFGRVEGVPALDEPGDGDDRFGRYAAAYGPRDPRLAAAEGRDRMHRLGQFARGMGLDYLLLFGATVDSDAHPTELSALDATLVGAYVVPTWQMEGRARASAVLVDVRTNRVVMTAGAEANARRYAPTATQEWRHEHLVRDLRDEVFRKLGARIVVDFARRAALPQGAAPSTAEASRVGTTDPFAASASPLTPDPAPRLTTGSHKPKASAPGPGPLPPDPVPPRNP